MGNSGIKGEKKEGGVAGSEKNEGGVAGSEENELGVAGSEKNEGGVAGSEKKDEGVAEFEKPEEGVAEFEKPEEGVAGSEKKDEGVAEFEKPEEGVAGSEKKDEGVAGSSCSTDSRPRSKRRSIRPQNPPNHVAQADLDVAKLSLKLGFNIVRLSPDDVIRMIELNEEMSDTGYDTDREERAAKRNSKVVAGGLAPVGQKVPKSRVNTKFLRYFHWSEIYNVKEIGRGAFGRMMQGTVLGRRTKPVVVAIKVLSAVMKEEVCTAHLAELMRVKHKNIVPILGVILEHVSSKVNGPAKSPRVLLQYFPDRDLITYISSKQNQLDYYQLGKFCLDIVNGMEFLHSRNIVHGNLAARNVIIQRSVGNLNMEYFNAKVSDFGFIQRDLRSLEKLSLKKFMRWWPKELFEMKQKGKPVKLSYKSDVWQFGVVIWEMWTKGAIPYGPCYSLKEVQEFALEGLSPLAIHRPHECPSDIVAVMKAILRVKPYERPTFRMLRIEFLDFRAYGVKGKCELQKAPSKEMKKILQAWDDFAQGKTLPEDEDGFLLETEEVLSGDDASDKKSYAAVVSDSGKSEKQDGKSTATTSGSKRSGNGKGSLQGCTRSSFKPKPPRKKNSRPPPHIRHNHKRGSYKPTSSGSNSSATRSAACQFPEPSSTQFGGRYTFSFTSAAARRAEIERIEKELFRLKTEDLKEELEKKQAELHEILRKLRDMGINDIECGSVNGNLFAPARLPPLSPLKSVGSFGENGDRAEHQRGGGDGGRGRDGDRDSKGKAKKDGKNAPK